MLLTNMASARSAAIFIFFAAVLLGRNVNSVRGQYTGSYAPWQQPAPNHDTHYAPQPSYSPQGQSPQPVYGNMPPVHLIGPSPYSSDPHASSYQQQPPPPPPPPPPSSSSSSTSSQQPSQRLTEQQMAELLHRHLMEQQSPHRPPPSLQDFSRPAPGQPLPPESKSQQQMLVDFMGMTQHQEPPPQQQQQQQQPPLPPYLISAANTQQGSHLQDISYSKSMSVEGASSQQSYPFPIPPPDGAATLGGSAPHHTQQQPPPRPPPQQQSQSQYSQSGGLVPESTALIPHQDPSMHPWQAPHQASSMHLGQAPHQAPNMNLGPAPHQAPNMNLGPAPHQAPNMDLAAALHQEQNMRIGPSPQQGATTHHSSRNGLPPLPVPQPGGAGIPGTGIGPQLNFGQQTGSRRVDGPFQCPRPVPGAMCGGTAHACNQDAHCERGAKCCPDACGMICMKAVPASSSPPASAGSAVFYDTPAMPGSLLVAKCIVNNCAADGGMFDSRATHSECDAIRACRAGYTCCFNGCRNVCRSLSQPQGGMFGDLFGGGVGGLDMKTMMFLMAAGGS